MMPTTTMAKGRRRKRPAMALVEKLLQKPKKRKFIHPVFQQLIERKNRVCWRSRRATPAAKKVLERAIFFYPRIPNARPFFCQQCGLSSTNLTILTTHKCGKKIGGFAECSNWQKIVSSGTRSKAKDAFAVLETIPFPHMANVHREPLTHHADIADKQFVFNPRCLRDLAYDVVVSKVYPLDTPPEIQVSEPEPEPAPLSNRQLIIDADPNDASTVGYYCTTCHRVYKPYFAYDEHIAEDGACPKGPPPIIVEVPKNVQINGKFPKIATKEVEQQDELLCTRCFRTSFNTVPDFHEHLFSCAANPELDFSSDSEENFEDEDEDDL